MEFVANGKNQNGLSQRLLFLFCFVFYFVSFCFLSSLISLRGVRNCFTQFSNHYFFNNTYLLVLLSLYQKSFSSSSQPLPLFPPVLIMDSKFLFHFSSPLFPYTLFSFPVSLVLFYARIATKSEIFPWISSVENKMWKKKITKKNKSEDVTIISVTRGKTTQAYKHPTWCKSFPSKCSRIKLNFDYCTCETSFLFV